MELMSVLIFVLQLSVFCDDSVASKMSSSVMSIWFETMQKILQYTKKKLVKLAYLSGWYERPRCVEYCQTNNKYYQRSCEGGVMISWTVYIPFSL